MIVGFLHRCQGLVSCLFFQIIDLECLTNLFLCHFHHSNGAGEKSNKLKWIYLLSISEKLIQAIVKKLCWLLKTSTCEFLPPCLWCLLVVHGVGLSQVQPSRATIYFSVFVLIRMNCQALSEDAVLCLFSFNWAALVVDEAHRLKNQSSLLYKTLSEVK